MRKTKTREREKCQDAQDVVEDDDDEDEEDDDEDCMPRVMERKKMT